MNYYYIAGDTTEYHIYFKGYKKNKIDNSIIEEEYFDKVIYLDVNDTGVNKEYYGSCIYKGLMNEYCIVQYPTTLYPTLVIDDYPLLLTWDKTSQNISYNIIVGTNPVLTDNYLFQFPNNPTDKAVARELKGGFNVSYQGEEYLANNIKLYLLPNDGKDYTINHQNGIYYAFEDNIDGLQTESLIHYAWKDNNGITQYGSKLIEHGYNRNLSFWREIPVKLQVDDKSIEFYINQKPRQDEIATIEYFVYCPLSSITVNAYDTTCTFVYSGQKMITYISGEIENTYETGLEFTPTFEENTTDEEKKYYFSIRYVDSEPFQVEVIQKPYEPLYLKVKIEGDWLTYNTDTVAHYNYDIIENGNVVSSGTYNHIIEPSHYGNVLENYLDYGFDITYKGIELNSGRISNYQLPYDNSQITIKSKYSNDNTKYIKYAYIATISGEQEITRVHFAYYTNQTHYYNFDWEHGANESEDPRTITTSVTVNGVEVDIQVTQQGYKPRYIFKPSSIDVTVPAEQTFYSFNYEIWKYDSSIDDYIIFSENTKELTFEENTTAQERIAAEGSIQYERWYLPYVIRQEASDTPTVSGYTYEIRCNDTFYITWDTTSYDIPHEVYRAQVYEDGSIGEYVHYMHKDIRFTANTNTTKEEIVYVKTLQYKENDIILATKDIQVIHQPKVPIITSYTYNIICPITSQTVEYYDTACTFNYTGITTAYYDDGTQKSTVEELSKTFTFEENDGDEREFNFTIEYHEARQDVVVIQKLCEYITGYTYDIYCPITSKTVSYSTTTATFNYTGVTIAHYNTGREERVETPLTYTTPDFGQNVGDIERIFYYQITYEDLEPITVRVIQADESSSGYLRLIPTEYNVTVTLENNSSYYNYPITAPQYSFDGINFTNFNDDYKVNVNLGQTVYLRGKGTHQFSHIKVSSECKCYGDVRSLLAYDDFENKPLYNRCFWGLFNNTKIITAPSILLATELAEECYVSMFAGTLITTAPRLIATELADGCYASMFQGCTNLTTATELPATTLSNTTLNTQGCYASMFADCTSLTATTELPALELTNGCYESMFSGCTSLTTPPELPATTLAYECYYCMFKGCTSLATVPELPSNTLVNYCYGGMFEGCTSLITVPNDLLQATTLADYCYNGMFQGCTRLTEAPELPATKLTPYCYCGMFASCTSLTTAPYLPAKILQVYAYDSMFRDCTNLNYVSVDAIHWNTLVTANWLTNVASSGTFEKRIDTDIPLGNGGIPFGWTIVNKQTPTTESTKAYDIDGNILRETNDVVITSGFCKDIKSSVTRVEIAEGVTKIDGYAFSNCKSLSLITIPETVRSIEMYAFAGTWGLSTVVIPSSVTSIGICAFYGSAISSLTLNSEYITLGRQAFRACHSLELITCTALSDPVVWGVNDYVFYESRETGTLVTPNSTEDWTKWLGRLGSEGWTQVKGS